MPPLCSLSTVDAVEELVLLSEPSMSETRRGELKDLTSTWRAAIGLVAQKGLTTIDKVALEALKPYITVLSMDAGVCECD